MESSENNNNKQVEIDKLKLDVSLAKRKKIFYDRLRKTVPISGMVIFSIMTILYFSFGHKHHWVLFVGVFYFIIAIVYPIIDPGKSINIEIEGLESAISLKITETNALEARAESLFKSHEIELRRYYDLELIQNNSIFIVGLICILIGLVFIGSTVYLIYYSPIWMLLETKILVASLGALSGVLTNFIALVYLKMFSKTMSSFETFHNKLVTTNHLHFINFLVSKIDDQKIRNDSFKSICDKISENIK